MVYNIKKSNGAPLVSIPDSTQDTTTTSLILPGRNAVNFGLSIDQNFVNLLQNFANTSPPPSPQQGQLWFDTINNDLKVFDGAKWVQVMSGFDGSGGVTTMRVGPDNTEVTIAISQYQIIMVVSGNRIDHADCPDSVIFNDISYAFAARFPDGIYAGINIATDPAGQTHYWVNGNATYANVLMHSRTISINGTMTGSFSFDGSKNVNVTVRDSNVYVTNSQTGTSNVTVAGTWTKVVVNDGGRVIGGNVLSSGDIVEALGFTPFQASNVNVYAVGNTIVGRDQYGSFEANVIVADSIVAKNFQGTAANASTLATARTIYIDGDVYGNVAFDGSNSVVIESTLVNSGVTPGTYNLVNVDAKGRVTNAMYEVTPPIGGIILFTQQVIPTGWTICDGSTVIDPVEGSITTPNLVAISSNLTIQTGQSIKYIMRTFGKTSNLSAGSAGTGPAIFIPGQQTINGAATAGTALSGGPVIQNITTAGSNVNIGTVGRVISNEGDVFTNTSFQDTAYFDAISYIMSLGDPNGIMFSKNDDWHNLASLTVQNVVDNLLKRANDNLAPFVGKYMLPLRIVSQQARNLGVPTNFPFNQLLQDQLVSSVTSNFAHQLSAAGITPTDNNLFGCHYLGSSSAWIAVLKSQPTDIVSATLHKIGYYTTETSNLDEYTKAQLTEKLAQILQIAKDEIQYRKTVGYNVIVSGQSVGSSNTNVIVTSGTVNGYYIGNNNFADMQGGYFPEYDTSTGNNNVSTSTVGPPTTVGSAGSVKMFFHDAGAAALAGILQTDNDNDSAGHAQLCLNRLGATLRGVANFGGKTGFEIATLQNTPFSALSAAIWGPNSDSAASAKYGDLYVNREFLRQALGLEDGEDFRAAINQLFRGRLTLKQLLRLELLRKQVFNNGVQLNQAQAAIGAATTTVPPDSTSPYVIKPFGDDAYGYLTSGPNEGFYVSNTSDAASPAPAPSPDALLDRVIKNMIRRPPISPGMMVWETPGSYTFSMPANHSVTIEAWGAGGGGGPISGAAGLTGGASSVTSQSLSLIAGGGTGGGAGYYRRGFGANGQGGVATGGITNLPGTNGGFGPGNAKGGSSPNGGNGGAAGVVAIGNHPGSNGYAPGGGGGGGYMNDGSPSPSYQGGGGGGGGSYLMYYSTAVSEKTILNVVVGKGGTGAPSGGTGGDGKVSISWN